MLRKFDFTNHTTAFILLITSIILSTSLYAQTNNIDPTGSYQLVSKTKKKHGEPYGYTGFIQVKFYSQDSLHHPLHTNPYLTKKPNRKLAQTASDDFFCFPDRSINV